MAQALLWWLRMRGLGSQLRGSRPLLPRSTRMTAQLSCLLATVPRPLDVLGYASRQRLNLDKVKLILLGTAAARREIPRRSRKVGVGAGCGAGPAVLTPRGARAAGPGGGGLQAAATGAAHAAGGSDGTGAGNRSGGGGTGCGGSGGAGSSGGSSPTVRAHRGRYTRCGLGQNTWRSFSPLPCPARAVGWRFHGFRRRLPW